MKKWYLHCKKADFADISQKFNITPMLARIIRNRDIIGDDAIKEYLYGTIDYMHSPYLFKGMSKAVDMVFDAIKNNKKIRVVGDYDVDGICSSYILKHTIKKLGGDVDVKIPDRVFDGYGMNENMSDEAFNDGIGLIITCDNGVSAYEAVDKAKSYGIDVIVTDHHEVPYPLVNADVIIDAKQEGCTYPYKELCGGAVAYKVAQALTERAKKEGKKVEEIKELDKLMDELLLYAGMATVADIVPLTSENRIFAKEGIKRLKITQNEGLKALMSQKNIEQENINAFYIGFILGPCINSAGRLKNALIAFNLLEEKDPALAKKKAMELVELNEVRKNLTISQTQIAIDQIERLAGNIPNVLVIFLSDAHESIAGIIAGRLKEEYSRPVLVITNSDEGLKGSGRSVDKYNMIEALTKNSDCFNKFGGHAKAAGFTLADGMTPEKLSEILNNDCDLAKEELEEKKWIDMQLPFQYISEQFINELGRLEPFGQNNEKPCFAEKNIKVNSIYMSRNANCLKFNLENESGFKIDGIMFRNEEFIKEQYEILTNAKEKADGCLLVSLIFYPYINYYRGEKNLQLKIDEIKIQN